MTPAEARRRARRSQLAGVAFLPVMVVVGGLVALGAFGGADAGKDASVTGGVRGVRETSDLLRGVPQDGIVLGRPDAPATIVEFADLKCSACRSFVLQQQPRIVRDLVRTGKANVELRLLAIKRFGPDTRLGRTAAYGLAARDRMWPLVELAYYNQRDEGQEWITPTSLSRIAARSPELRGVAVGLAETTETRRLSAEADALARRLDVTATPTLFVRPRGATDVDAYRRVAGGPFRDPAEDVAAAVAKVTRR
jgi:protein-disulfide isomerase